ncbi:hypothetical protein HCU64_02805 [Methylobacterium sp. C25]|uniref:hypothetical protein n=1 Tax=Methylobacterium sp. C25 TaxID=2721622 RepID=UPI001F341F41|nr:hypothetical protein [Methylobacterium sp. C25]MCE4222670.1 hypothetical protein [Methylobacterium sp. C25]
MQRNKVSAVFTLARVAAGLGVDEDALCDIIVDMDPEDGLIWVHGLGDEACPALTRDGINKVKVRIAAHRAEKDLPPPKPKPTSPSPDGYPHPRDAERESRHARRHQHDAEGAQFFVRVSQG